MTVSMAKPYVSGDPITQGEYRAIVKLFFPKQHIRGKMKDVLKRISDYRPMRLEHEVNRLRGFAFDIGEHGSSYEHIDHTATPAA